MENDCLSSALGRKKRNMEGKRGMMREIAEGNVMR